MSADGGSVKARLLLDTNQFDRQWDKELKKIATGWHSIESFAKNTGGGLDVVSKKTKDIATQTDKVAESTRKLKEVQSSSHADFMKEMAEKDKAWNNHTASVSYGIKNLDKSLKGLSGRYGDLFNQITGIGKTTPIRYSASDFGVSTQSLVGKAQKDTNELIREGIRLNERLMASTNYKQELDELYKLKRARVELNETLIKPVKSSQDSDFGKNYLRDIESVRYALNNLDADVTNKYAHIYNANNYLDQSTRTAMTSMRSSMDETGLKAAEFGDRVNTSMGKAEAGANKGTSAFRLLHRASFMLEIAGGVMMGVFGFNALTAFTQAATGSMMAKQEMEGLFRQMGWGASQIQIVTDALESMNKQWPKVNKYQVGAILANVAAMQNLNPEETAAMTKPAAMVYTQFLRGGRTPQDAQLAIREVVEGEFIRLSRETGVGQKDLVKAGWTGNVNDKVSMMAALEKIGYAKHWDTFTSKIQTLDDALQVAGNTVGEFLVLIGDVMLPAISSLALGFAGLTTGLREWWESLGKGPQLAIVAGIIALMLGLFVAFIPTMVAAAAATGLLSGAMGVLGTTMLGIPIIGWVAAFALLAGGIIWAGTELGWFTTELEKAREQQGQLNQKISEANAEYDDAKKLVATLKTELAQLTPGTEAYKNKVNELKEAQNGLNTAESNQAYANDVLKKSLDGVTLSIEQNVAARKELQKQIILWKQREGLLSPDEAAEQITAVNKGELDADTKAKSDLAVEYRDRKPGERKWGGEGQANWDYDWAEAEGFGDQLWFGLGKALNPGSGENPVGDYFQDALTNFGKWYGDIAETISKPLQFDIAGADKVIQITDFIILLWHWITGNSPGLFPALRELDSLWTQIWENIYATCSTLIMPIILFIQWLWAELNKGWDWFYNSIVMPFYNALLLLWNYAISLGVLIQAAWNGWLGPLVANVSYHVNQIVNAWNAAKASLISASNSIRDGVWGPISQLWNNLSSFWNFIRNPGGAGGSRASSVVSNIGSRASTLLGAGIPGAGFPGVGPDVTIPGKKGAGFLGGIGKTVADSTNALMGGVIPTAGRSENLPVDKSLQKLFSCNDPEKCSAGWDGMSGWTSQALDAIMNWQMTVFGTTFSLETLKNGGMGLFEKLAGAMMSGIGYSFYFGDGKSNAEVLSSRSCNCYDGAQLIVALAQSMGLNAGLTNGFWGSIPHTWATVGSKTFDTTAFQHRGTWTGPAQRGAGFMPGNTSNSSKIISLVINIGDVYDRVKLLREIKGAVNDSLNEVADGLYV